MLPDWAKSRQNDKKLPNWQKFTKVAKSPQIRLQGFQGVPDGSRSQTACARTTGGTYAQAPYAFAKGPELVLYKIT